MAAHKRLGRVHAPEGIGITLSISNVSGISGLKTYAERFAKANDINAKNPGYALIAFDDPLSTNLDKDHRPFCTIYEYNKEGRHYPAMQGMKGSTCNKYVKMANKIADAVHKDFVDSFGDKAEDCVVTKLTLIGYGSRDQVAHYDQKPKDKEKSREELQPGSMIYNIGDNSDCRIGIVTMGDSPEDVRVKGSTATFQNCGGVAFTKMPIPTRCFAWLDCNVAHFGAAHNGPCVRLHASVKHKTHLDGIGEPDAVHVVDILSLMKKKQEEGQTHLALLLKMSSRTDTHH
jgi:hypothetical protein